MFISLYMYIDTHWVIRNDNFFKYKEICFIYYAKLVKVCSEVERKGYLWIFKVYEGVEGLNIWLKIYPGLIYKKKSNVFDLNLDQIHLTFCLYSRPDGA